MAFSLKYFGKISLKFLISTLVIVMIIYFPAINFTKSQADLIYTKFVGNKSGYNGIIEVWNIDTFDGVTKSKASVLNEIAMAYSDKNKGVSFVIKNMTEFECFSALNRGEYPDLFSASYGISKKLKNYIKPFENIETELYSNFLEAGKSGGFQYGVAWCFESYFLISTESKLAAAKVDLENKQLHDVSLTSGYQVKNKKTTKNIYSISTSKSKYLLPEIALEAYNGIGLKTNIELAVNKNTLSASQFSAYSNFILGNSVILLGTNHDVYRLKNREKIGKTQGIVIEPLTKFTDLVCFVFESINVVKEKGKEIQKFVSFLTGKIAQKIVSNSKMFPVSFCENSEIESVMTNITPEIISNYKLNNVFN